MRPSPAVGATDHEPSETSRTTSPDDSSWVCQSRQATALPLSLLRIAQDSSRPSPQRSVCDIGSDEFLWCDIASDISQHFPTICAASQKSGSMHSFSTSPGENSSDCLTEDHHSLSGGFPERPSHSLVPLSHAACAKSQIPELVMPSMTLSQKHSFTGVGRGMGKLKMLIAGRDGIGKTSLIMAISRHSSHIVSLGEISMDTRDCPADVYASTRPKPWWGGSDSDCDRSRRRGCSISDKVLDLNICFVDCPMGDSDDVQASWPAISYVESQLEHLLSKPMNDSDLHKLLSSGAEPIVDAVLYLVPHTGPSQNDIACLRSLQHSTNVIPLLARAESLNADEVFAAKNKIAQELKSASISCFSFESFESPSEASGIYAVSSAIPPGREALDDSMNLAPLPPAELSDLINELFPTDGGSWLRHSAASKAITWIRSQRNLRKPQHSALMCRDQARAALIPSSYYVSMHLGQRYWCRIETVSWAQSLRQSLENERYNPFMEDESRESGAEMPLMRRDTHRHCSKPGFRSTISSGGRHQDPLGLLQVLCQLRVGGRLTLELLSSLGALGYVVAWIVRPQ